MEHILLYTRYLFLVLYHLFITCFKFQPDFQFLSPFRHLHILNPIVFIRGNCNTYPMSLTEIYPTFLEVGDKQTCGPKELKHSVVKVWVRYRWTTSTLYILYQVKLQLIEEIKSCKSITSNNARMNISEPHTADFSSRTCVEKLLDCSQPATVCLLLLTVGLSRGFISQKNIIVL